MERRSDAVYLQPHDAFLPVLADTTAGDEMQMLLPVIAFELFRHAQRNRKNRRAHGCTTRKPWGTLAWSLREK